MAAVFCRLQPTLYLKYVCIDFTVQEARRDLGVALFDRSRQKAVLRSGALGIGTGTGDFRAAIRLEIL